jgi:minor histocompatibility antigen H13
MLAVATSDAVTGPTRLLFPRIPGGGGEAADFPFSLLGLGDIALPGLLAALALRYDASRRQAPGGGGRGEAERR